jgi:hypothetical protein
MLEVPAANISDLTVGELCLAIGDGRLPAKLEDDHYTVSWREIARYLGDQAIADFAPHLKNSAE